MSNDLMTRAKLAYEKQVEAERAAEEHREWLKNEERMNKVIDLIQSTLLITDTDTLIDINFDLIRNTGGTYGLMFEIEGVTFSFVDGGNSLKIQHDKSWHIVKTLADVYLIAGNKDSE